MPGDPAAAAEVEVPAVVSEKLAALAVDEPLPEVYGSDRISLLVQSPYRIFMYWNFARDPFATLRKAFGDRADDYRVAVRLTDLDGGDEQTHEASPFASNYWFNVRPGRSFRASVGLLAPGRPFLKLLASQVARTPRTTPSPRVDDSREFRAPSIDFARALNEAGFVESAIEVGLEARDADQTQPATPALAYDWAHVEVGAADASELSELRTLLAAIAAGADLDELRASLSPRLRALFDRLLESLDVARLRELLAGALGFEITPIEETEMPLRPVWGASEVFFPRRVVRVVAARPAAGEVGGLVSNRGVPSSHIHRRS